MARRDPFEGALGASLAVLGPLWRALAPFGVFLGVPVGVLEDLKF